jgi:ribulose-phosphate 3-epimerase
MFIFPSPPQQTIQDLQPVFELFNGLCAGYHIDIMDGKFVPQSMGSIDLVNQLHEYTQNQLWVHLMVQDPIKYIEKLSIAPGSIITFHYEAVELEQAEELAQLIRDKNMRPSLAINPNTPLSGPLCLTYAFDHFLIMAVEPGSSGQPFIQKTVTRAQELDIYQKTHSSHISLAIDGGINSETIIPLKKLSIDHIAVTSGIFNKPDPVEAFKILQKKESLF